MNRRFQFNLRNALLLNVGLAMFMTAAIVPALGTFRAFGVVVPIGWLVGLGAGNASVGFWCGFAVATVYVSVWHYWGHFI